MTSTQRQSQGELIATVEQPPAVFLQQLEDSTGDYTAERFQSRRPDDYKLVLALLARGWGAQRVANHFKDVLDRPLSKNTVKAVRAMAGETIDLLRERLAAEAYVAADDFVAAAVQIVEETMGNRLRRDKLTLRDAQSLMVAAGIATQNAQLLAGLPTARIQLDDLNRPTHDDFNAQLKKLAPISIDPPTTHLMGETPGQKEGAALAPTAPAVPAVPGPAAPPAVDSQSEADDTKRQ